MAAAFLVGLAPTLGAQGVGPALPPGFYGELPAPYPDAEAPAGIERMALVATSNIVGEVDPCG